MIDLPKLLDIATKQVVTIHESKTIQDAVYLMYSQNHRDVVILSEEKRNFGIIKANDLVKFKAQGVSFDTKLKDIKYDSVFAVHCEATIPQAINEINDTCSCICLVDNEDRLCGYVSYYDIISSVDPKMMLEKRTLSDILINSYIKRAEQDTNTSDVISLMDNSIYDSVVIFNGNKGIGIITTKDIVKLFGEDKDLNLPISEYMSTPLHTVKHTTTISQALDYIQSQHFKRLIVEDNDGHIVGQITQEELIARVYARWADFMRNEKSQLAHVNKVLEARATKMEQLASVDKLTGLYNRLKFETSLKEEISRVIRYETSSFCVCLFDVDNFKKLNDSYGHLAGDLVLQKLSYTARHSLRVTDLVCRWGGEEFAIIMPMTSLSHGMEACEKLRKAINGIKFDDIGHISCSFGVAEFEKDDNIQSLMMKADKAMYAAKAKGKNRVEGFENKE